MNKPFKILSSTAMATALATTALVPAVAADTPSEVPAPATQLAEVIFNDNGQLVSLDVTDYTQALAAKAVDSKPTHVSAKDGSVYTVADYTQALAAEKTPAKALELLYKAEEAVEADVVPGKIVDKQVVAENSAGVVKEGKLNIETVEEITADGVTTEVVKFQILDKEGKVDKTANDVVLEIGSTYGFLSQERLTIQNGEGEVILRSEFLKKVTEAKISAQVIEAKDSHKELIGKLAGEKIIKFVPAGMGEAGEEVTIKQVVAANSNQADRVTLFFDEEVTPADFYTVQEGNKNTAQILNNLKISNNSDHSEAKAIAGFLFHDDNPKAVTVVLERNSYLTDNTDVYVSYDHIYDGTAVKNSKVNFKLADARTANVTGVKVKDNKTLLVSFSEAVDKASFTIDGQYVSPEHFDVTYGDVQFKEGRYVDNRDMATITLKPAYAEQGHVAGYFKPGVHALETANIYDFAANTDSENIGKTQVLEFVIEKDSAVAEATQEVHSPEQFKLEFDKPVQFKNGNKTATLEEVMSFQAWDKDANNKKGEWVNVDEYLKDVKGGLGQDALKDILRVEEVNPGVFKIEMTEDWTKVYNTKDTKDNYYNDDFRLVLPKNTVLTVGNGNLNKEDIHLPLTVVNGKGTALATPDTESPVIRDIQKVDDFNAETNPRFVVQMSEPVKLFPDGDEAGKTLSQAQEADGELPETLVEFLGKDKNGKTRTFIGKVVEFGDAWNTKLIVEWDQSLKDTPQTLVDAGGSTNWTIVVKSISDDVGNTAATVTRDFTLTKTPEEVVDNEFRVDPKGENGSAVGEDGSRDTFKVYGEQGEKVDTIEITYTEAVAVTGLGSATNVKNYSLNGKDLPTGASIALGTTDGKVDPKKVVIKLKHDGKNVLKETNVITLAKQIKSASGKDLKYDVTFTFKTTKDDTPQTPGANKTELNNLIDAANKALEGTKDVDLEKALEGAKTVQDNKDATQAEVDQAAKDLQAALDKFNNEKPTDPEQPVDKKALETALENAKNADTEGKTPESVKALEDAIKAAEVVFADADATQEKVDEAAKALDQAVADLKDNPEEPGEEEPMKATDFVNNPDDIEIDKIVDGLYIVTIHLKDIKDEFKGKDFKFVFNGEDTDFEIVDGMAITTVQPAKDESEARAKVQVQVVK